MKFDNFLALFLVNAFVANAEELWRAALECIPMDSLDELAEGLNEVEAIFNAAGENPVDVNELKRSLPKLKDKVDSLAASLDSSLVAQSDKADIGKSKVPLEEMMTRAQSAPRPSNEQLEAMWSPIHGRVARFESLARAAVDERLKAEEEENTFTGSLKALFVGSKAKSCDNPMAVAEDEDDVGQDGQRGDGGGFASLSMDGADQDGDQLSSITIFRRHPASERDDIVFEYFGHDLVFVAGPSPSSSVRSTASLTAFIAVAVLMLA